MAKPRSKKAKENVVASMMLDAITFVSCAQRPIGAPFQTHCRIANGSVIAFDSVLAAGHPIDESITACPHTGRLIAALKNCSQGFSLTQLESNRLSIVSGKFRSLIPCALMEEVPFITPDAPTIECDEKLMAALATVQYLAAENSPQVLTASILFRSGSCVATNRTVILERWHGISLPFDVVVPKTAIAAVIKTGKVPVKLGLSQSSITFHFENGLWIKSQVYTEKWPDTDSILSVEANPLITPESFFEAVKSVAASSEDNAVHFLEGAVSSHTTLDEGACCELEGVPTGLIYNSEDLLNLAPFATKFDFVKNPRITYFFGDFIRGAICTRAP